VLVLEPSTSQARASSCQITRVMQKVKEAEPMRSKSKGRGKAKVDNKTMEEVQKEKVERLKEIIDQLEA
jgi:hypothetical protein